MFWPGFVWLIKFFIVDLLWVSNTMSLGVFSWAQSCKALWNTSINRSCFDAFSMLFFDSLFVAIKYLINPDS